MIKITTKESTEIKIKPINEIFKPRINKTGAKTLNNVVINFKKFFVLIITDYFIHQTRDNNKVIKGSNLFHIIPMRESYRARG
jgi:hypothetical protein